MSATCRFCDQQFANAQAVRAHLKGCAAYKARPGNTLANEEIPRERGRIAASLGNELPHFVPSDRADQPEKPFDPVHQLRQRLAAERTRLQLREVEDAHAELDRRAEAKERERQQQAEQKAIAERMAKMDRENAQRVAEDKRREREGREAAESQSLRRCREIIQSVKQEVVEHWFAPVLGRSDLKARALQDIERKLTALPVVDLPRAELVLIAEAIRDGIYREVVENEQRSREEAARRQGLIEHGCNHAARELRQAEGLRITEVWAIERRVREELEAAEADETTDDIEDWVDDILEDEGVEWDEDDD
jgi:hypothetical protein